MTNPFDRNQYTMSHPESIIRGLHSGWRLDLEHEPPQGVKYKMQQIGGDVSIEVNGEYVVLEDGPAWVFEISSTDSNAWGDFEGDGEFRWDLILTEGINEALLKTGFVRIFQSTSDRRSHAEVMVGKINSILEGRADSDVSSYSIKSRSLTRLSIDELIRWRDYYISEVKRTGSTGEDDGVKRGRPNCLRVRFVR